jgi:hypothetical protein
MLRNESNAPAETIAVQFLPMGAVKDHENSSGVITEIPHL